MRKRTLILVLSLLMVCAAAGLPAALAEGDLTLYLVEGETRTELGSSLELSLDASRVTLNYGETSDSPADSGLKVDIADSEMVLLKKSSSTANFFLIPSGAGSTTVTVTLSDGRSATFTVTVSYAVPDEVEVSYDDPDVPDSTLTVEDEHTIPFSGDPYPFYVRALAGNNPNIVDADAITFAWSFENNTCGAAADDQNRVTVTGAGSAEVTVEALLNGVPTGVAKTFTLNAVWQVADEETLCIKAGGQAVTGLRWAYGSDKVELTYVDEEGKTQMIEADLEGLTLTYDAANIAYVDTDDMLWESNKPAVVTAEDGKVSFHVELAPGDRIQAVLSVVNSSHTVAANLQIYVYSTEEPSTGDTGSGCGGSSAAVSLLAVTAAAAVLLKKFAVR